MKVTPYLNTLSLAIWGYCHNQLVVGLLLSGIIAATTFLKKRIDIDLKQLTRICDFCIIVFAVVYYLNIDRNAVSYEHSTTAMRWMPAIFFPLMLIHSLGNVITYDLRCFFILTRAQAIANPNPERYPFRLDIFYIAMTLFAMAAAETPWQGLFWTSVVVLFALLWSQKPVRHSRLAWGVTALVIIGSSYYLQHSYSETHKYLRKKAGEWFGSWYTSGLANNDQSAPIGKIGQIQKTHTIVGRVRPRVHRGTYLKMTTYNYLFDESNWMSQASFQKIPFRPPLIVGQGEATQVKRHMDLAIPGGTGYIALPIASNRIDDMTATSVMITQNGGIQAIDGPEWLHVNLSLGYGDPIESPPSEADIFVSRSIRKWLAPYVVKHFNHIKRYNEMIPTLMAHFSAYTYTLELEESPGDTSQLRYFLEKSKAGHCEYFATLTALILRLKGIPARYTTGYYMDEYSELEQANVIRASDAHAWVRAWDANRMRWLDVETTPGGPPEATGWSSWFNDRRDYLLFHLHKWRFSIEGEDQLLNLLPWSLPILVIYFTWRMRKSRFKPTENSPKSEDDTPMQEEEIAMARILDWFQSRGLEKRIGETYNTWLYRIEKEGDRIPNPTQLSRAVSLYYRKLYHPDLMPSRDLNDLRHSLTEWLNQAQPARST